MFFILWLILAGLVAYYYREKGLNPLLGFLLSVILSPLLAFIIALFLQPGSFAIFGKTKKCPRCAEIIKEEAKVCRYCGHEFRFEPEINEEVVEVKEILSEEERRAIEEKKQKERKLNIILTIIFILGTLIALFLMIAFINYQVRLANY